VNNLRLIPRSGPWRSGFHDRQHGVAHRGAEYLLDVNRTEYDEGWAAGDRRQATRRQRQRRHADAIHPDSKAVKDPKDLDLTPPHERRHNP